MAANNFNNWDNGFPYQFVETTAGVAANTSGNFFFFFH